MAKIDTFKYIDAAQRFTIDGCIDIANVQWSDIDNLVNAILERIPNNRHDDYLEIVTRPNF